MAKMFKRLQRWNAKRDFKVYLHVWLQNNQELIDRLLQDVQSLNSYNAVIDEVSEGASIVDQSFMFTSIYISARILPTAEEEDIRIFEECINQKSFENIPYIFWLIFHFLYLGALHIERGELSNEAFLFGRNKIIAFFVGKGMKSQLVRDFLADGVLNYRSMVREVVAGKME